jgi:hypothetical protein
VEISSEQHRTLLVAQAQGKLIQPDANGRPVAVDPPAPPAPNTEELAALARAERDRLMREVYDPAMMQLLRRHRTAVTAGADTAEINASIAAWDAYAIALEGVPEQAGFPNEIVWPQEPAADAEPTA